MTPDFDAAHAVTAPFRMQPGLRKMAADARHFTPLSPGARHLREKLAVLSHWPEQAICLQAGFDAGPALRRAAQQAELEWPQAWSVDSDGRWHAHRLGWSVGPDGSVHEDQAIWSDAGACLHALPAPWRQWGLMAMAFAEDLAVVDGRTGSMAWLSVCLPSQWAPEDKVGRRFAEVHAPVADNQMLIQAADHLVRLVTGAQCCERFVWTITPHPWLHAHPARVSEPRWPSLPSGAEVARLAYWRTERQTFLPLPERAQAVFTIRTDLAPLEEAMRDPTLAQRSHDALASMSPAVLAYRELTQVRVMLLAWLRERAAMTP